MNYFVILLLTFLAKSSSPKTQTDNCERALIGAEYKMSDGQIMVLGTRRYGNPITFYSKDPNDYASYDFEYRACTELEGYSLVLCGVTEGNSDRYHLAFSECTDTCKNNRYVNVTLFEEEEQYLTGKIMCDE